MHLMLEVPKKQAGINITAGTFRFANTTVDAFVGMDHEHILALVEAVHGAHGNAIHGFAANAAFVDDKSQFSTPNIS